MSPIISALGGAAIGLALLIVCFAIGEAMSRKKERNAHHDPSFYARRNGEPGTPSDRLSSVGRHRRGKEARGAGTARGAGNSAHGGSHAGTGAGMNPLDAYYVQMMNRLSTQVPQYYTYGSGTSKRSAEFGEKQFSAGVARGARSFRIDRLGRLTGVAYKKVWTPGENLAKCEASDAFTPCPGMDKCGHGFYGYYDGSDDYHESGMVSAVVEGYGEAVIGTRGFRAMKARIVALHIPDTVKPSEARLVRRNYPDIPVFDTFERMVSEFAPDDGGEGISPESDPNFWTREA